MTDGRILPQELAATMLAARGYQIDAPAHMGWEAPTTSTPTEPTLLDKQAFDLLVNSGWGVTPPPAGWQPVFTPQFYEAGGDQQGQVYVRVDLPEGLYYGFQDAAREGLTTMKVRLDRFQQLERNVADLERNAVPGKPREIGRLDGIDLTSLELRGMISILADKIKRWEAAVERADTRRRPR